MKRLGIVSIYDSEGIIYEYLLYYIESLNEILDKMIVIVNGYLEKKEIKKLEKFTREIYVRDNIGFDAGAYKYLLKHIIPLLEMKKYDEMILTNDTCFGPFIPFIDIFEKMERENLDFWGMNYIDNNIFQYIQSNFLVFKQNVFCDVYNYFLSEIDDKAKTKHQVCMQFERGLFRFLHEKGYSHGVYASKNTFDCYASPDYLIEECKYPFLKKRAFEIYWEDYKHNLIHAMALIAKLYTYDLDLIVGYLKYKNREILDIRMDENKTKEIHYDVADITQKDISNLCNKYNNIYIYGGGFWGQDIYAYYKNVLRNFKGFIVSDKHYSQQSILGEAVYKFSQVKATDIGIIVGVSRDTSREVKACLGSHSNILYLWNK